MLFFYLVLTIVITQRLVELIISKKNEKWLLNNGGIEYGKDHYKFIVALHILFFMSIFTEFNLSGRYKELNIINYLFLVFFLILQVLRVWILLTLGKYWNTRVIRIPNSELVRTGPYKYFRHPNYIIVICEIFLLPMIFNLYYTAIVFSLLNAIILNVRIKTENKALVT